MSTNEPDFADIRGMLRERRALEIAAAGGHNVLLIGPPGSGKTLLARRLTTILPDWDEETHRQSAMIWWGAGAVAGGGDYNGLEPPRGPCFRAPHYTVSAAGMFGSRNGCGVHCSPGEVSLAHGGVLFLDELPEFRRDVLGELADVIAAKYVVLRRSGSLAHVLPAAFRLVAAMNPCPCGYAGAAATVPACRCRPQTIAEYTARVAGIAALCPIVVRCTPTPLHNLESEAEDSATIRARVIAARARLQEPILPSYAAVCTRIGRVRHAHAVAATIAALEGTTHIEGRHMLEASDLAGRYL